MAKKIDNRRAILNGLSKAMITIDGSIENALRAEVSSIIETAIAYHNFDNQTGNLENSYGWAIYHNGLLMDSFINGDGEGAQAAKKLIGSYLPSFTWEAIVVAGAYYAKYVEGFIRTRDGVLSKAGDELYVLGVYFDNVNKNFVQTLKSLSQL